MTRPELALIVGIAAAYACAAPAPPPTAVAPADDPAEASSDLEVRALTDGVWVHTSSRELSEYGLVPSNGLVVRGARGALLVDTAWTPEQTARVLDWARAEVGGVTAAIVTHWHDDRTGGLSELERRGIPVYAAQRSLDEARRHGLSLSARAIGDEFSLDELGSLGLSGEVFFPGAGHTLDNVVVWLADSAVLFGGCLIKAREATSLGNVADADLEAWPASVQRLQARYPGVRHVVPGHGAAGDRALLSHTITLFSRNGTPSEL